ncbi:MAG: hypothetical protein KF716_26380 [Anaerolineae bacterium]|nr:hypothetical protein [Anaerolineae bacterium]
MKATPLNRLDLALMLAIVVIAIFARVLPSPRNVDDSFITFRYSRNIVEGKGFVYNEGERVLGTTTPLFTVLMAAISAMVGGQDFPYYALTVSALADAATAMLLLLIMRRLTGNRWAGALIGVLWAIAPISVTFAIGGMETSVNILWIVLATYCYLEDRPIWLGVAVGLGLLTRIDAALWIAPLGLHQVWEAWRKGDGALIRRLPWRTWIAALLVITPWLIFSFAYFGTPVTRTFSAKIVAYKVDSLQAFVRLTQQYSTPFFEFDTVGSTGTMIAAVVYLTLSVFGLLHVGRKLPRLLPFLIYPWLYFAVFAIANPLIFRWYLAPPMPALMMGLLAGLCYVITPKRRVFPYALAVVGAAWIGMSLNAWTLHPDHGPDRPAPKMAWHKIELLYQEVGTELREKYGVTDETVVASADIGAIGYFTRARIIDMVGLVTPDAAQYYPLDPALVASDQNFAIPAPLILDKQPAYLVTMEGFVRLTLEPQAAFKQLYGDPIIVRPFEAYGSDMRVYKHQ